MKHVPYLDVSLGHWCIERISLIQYPNIDHWPWRPGDLGHAETCVDAIMPPWRSCATQGPGPSLWDPNELDPGDLLKTMGKPWENGGFPWDLVGFNGI